MAFAEKEYFEGTWQGRQVKFNRTFRGKRLTDDECRRLCSGEIIEIDGLVAKNGNKYGVTGQLADLEYNGHPYVGVNQIGFIERIPAVWCNHTFTPDEIAALEAGVPVELTDAVSKRTGKTFSCSVTWKKTDDGKMALVPDFGK